MMFLIALVHCVWAVAAQPVDNSEFFPEFIINGTSVPIESIPHQVAILNREYLHCSGTILSESYILTAGHCTLNLGWVPELTVRAGSSMWNSSGSLHYVDQIITHEKFNTDDYGSLVNDIALLHLETPIVFDDTRRPAQLFDRGLKASIGQAANVSGWGATKWESNGYVYDDAISPDLQLITIEMFDTKKCSDDYAAASYGILLDGQICAADPESHKDMCFGDSGGPLMIDGFQVGIVSRSGPGCASPDFPGVYTEVSYFRDWIDEHMKN